MSSRVKISLVDKSDTVSVPARALPRSLKKLVKDQVLDTRFISNYPIPFQKRERGIRVYRAVEEILKFLALMSNVLICDGCCFGTPYGDRYYDNHFGLYCNEKNGVDFESKKVGLNWLHQFELHATMSENTENIIKLFRDTVVSLMIESGYSVIKLNCLKKKFCEEIAESMVDGDYFLKTQTKRKTDFPSPPRKYIRGRSQSSSIYLDDFIPLKSDDASTISPVSPPLDCEEKEYSGRTLKRPNSLRLVCSYESPTGESSPISHLSSIPRGSSPISPPPSIFPIHSPRDDQSTDPRVINPDRYNWDEDYIKALLNNPPGFKCSEKNCPVCILSPVSPLPNSEENPIIVSPEPYDLRNPSPPPTFALDDTSIDSEPPSPLPSESVSIF